MTPYFSRLLSPAGTAVAAPGPAFSRPLEVGEGGDLVETEDIVSVSATGLSLERASPTAGQAAPQPPDGRQEAVARPPAEPESRAARPPEFGEPGVETAPAAPPPVLSGQRSVSQPAPPSWQEPEPEGLRPPRVRPVDTPSAASAWSPEPAVSVPVAAIRPRPPEDIIATAPERSGTAAEPAPLKPRELLDRALRWVRTPESPSRMEASPPAAPLASVLAPPPMEARETRVVIPTSEKPAQPPGVPRDGSGAASPSGHPSTAAPAAAAPVEEEVVRVSIGEVRVHLEPPSTPSRRPAQAPVRSAPAASLIPTGARRRCIHL